MKRYIVYVILLIFTGIFVYLSVTSKTTIGEGIFAVTASGSIFSMIFKYFLDENKQLNDHYLNSNIVYSIYIKLTEFGDEYVQKLYETLDFLMTHGRHEKSLDYARDLYLIKRKYIIYLDKDIITKLNEFEGELRFIGANVGLLKHITDKEERGVILDKVLNRFLVIVNQDTKEGKKDEEKEKKTAIDYIINEITNIIGATKIIKKRNNLI